MNCKSKKILTVILTVAMSICMLFAIGITSAFADGGNDTYSFVMNEKAQAKIIINDIFVEDEVEVKNAIRFTSMIEKSAIEDNEKDHDVKVKTIIAKESSLKALDGLAFTKANLDEKEIKYQEVVFSENKNLKGVESEDGLNYVFRACLYNLKDANFTENLCAVSYLEIDGEAIQHTGMATSNLWNIAKAQVSSDDDLLPEEIDYLSSVCATYDVTISNGTEELYVQNVKHGETLAKYIGNAEFGKAVAEVENFSYPTAFVNSANVDYTNTAITSDIELTAVYGDEGKVQIDGEKIVGVGKKLFNYTTEVVVPETYNGVSVKEIDDGALMRLFDMTKITLPESVTKIGHEAFFACDKLETVIMPGVTYIGVNEGGVENCRQFMGCNALTTIVVGETFEVELVTDLGTGNNRCFYVEGDGAVPGQMDVYLTSANGTAEYYTGSRTQNMFSGKVYYYSETDCANTWKYVDGVPTASEFDSHNIVDGACSRCGADQTLGLSYAKYENKDEYYVSGYTGSDTVVYIRSTYNSLPVTAVGIKCFNGNTNITKVVMPKSVTTIHGEAFSSCTALQTVIMPGVTSISTYTASGSSLGVAENHHFLNCNSLIAVVVGDNFDVITGAGTSGAGQRVFHTDTTGLGGQTKVYLSSINGYLRIDNHSSRNGLLAADPYRYSETDCFRTWKYVNGVPTASTVKTPHTYNENNVCETCGAESVFTFTANSDNTYAVSSYTGSDKEVYIPETYNGKDITVIGASAFENNTSITKVVMSNKVNTIKHHAFYNCKALKTVIMPGMTEVSSSADNYEQFYFCDSLTTIVVGENFSSLVGAGLSGAKQRIFGTDTSADKVPDGNIKVYLSSADGTVTVHNYSSRNRLLNTTPVHYSATQQSGCWYYDANGNVAIWG